MLNIIPFLGAITDSGAMFEKLSLDLGNRWLQCITVFRKQITTKSAL